MRVMLLLVLLVPLISGAEISFRVNPNWGIGVTEIPPVYPQATTWRHVARLETFCVQPAQVQRVVQQINSLAISLARIRDEVLNKTSDRPLMRSTLMGLEDRMKNGRRRLQQGLQDLAEAARIEDDLAVAGSLRVCPIPIPPDVISVSTARRRRDLRVITESASQATDPPQPSDTLLMVRVGSPSTGQVLRLGQASTNHEGEAEKDTPASVRAHPLITVNTPLGRDMGSIPPISGEVSPSARPLGGTGEIPTGELPRQSVMQHPRQIPLDNTMHSPKADAETHQPGGLEILGSTPPPDGLSAATVHVTGESAHRRVKRGNIFSWVGKNFLGLATEEDIEDVNKLVLATQEQTQANADMIVKLSDALASVSHSLDVKTEAIMHEMENRTNEIAIEIEKWSNRVSQQFVTLQKHDQAIHMLSALQVLASMVSNVEEQLSALMDAIARLRDRRFALSQLAASRVTSSALVPSSVLAQIIASLNPESQGTYTIPSSVTVEHLRRAPIASAYIEDGEIRVILDIPVMRISQMYQTARVVTAPLAMRGGWAKLELHNGPVLLSSKPDGLMTLTELSYSQCRERVIPVCPLVGAWVSLHAPDCLIAAVVGDPLPESQCAVNIVSAETAPIISPVVTPWTSNSWLVSSNSSDVRIVIECLTTSGLYVPADILVATPLTAVILKAGCRARVGNYRMEAMDNMVVSQGYIATPLTPFQYQAPTNSLEDILKLIHINQTRVELIPPIKFIRTYNNSRTAGIEKVRVHMDKLMSDLKQRTAVYKSDTLAREIAFKTSAEYITAASGLSWWKLCLIGVAGLLVLLLVVTIFRKLMGTMTGAGVITGMLPMARGMPLAPLVSSGALTDGDTAGVNYTVQFNETMAQLISEIHSGVHIFGPDLPHLTAWWPWISLFLSTLTMYMLHWWLVRRVASLRRFMSSRFHFFPTNLRVRHHTGETQLVGTFGLRISPLIGVPETVTFCGQLATLPGTISDWYVRADPPTHIPLKGPSVTWLHSHLNCELQWGQLCIKHHHHPNLDTCQDLPTKCTFSLEDVLASQLYHTPSWWSTFSIIAMTELSIVKRGVTKIIWQAGSKRVANHSLHAKPAAPTAPLLLNALPPV
ncbi:ORF1 [ollusvirus 1]|nr:ORF1 [ollusvirus 1]